MSSIYFTGVDLKKIKDCVGDPHADVENPVLKAEQDAQVGFLKCKHFFMLSLFFFFSFRQFCCFMSVL